MGARCHRPGIDSASIPVVRSEHGSGHDIEPYVSLCFYSAIPNLGLTEELKGVRYSGMCAPPIGACYAPHKGDSPEQKCGKPVIWAFMISTFVFCSLNSIRSLFARLLLFLFVIVTQLFKRQ